jgi:ABC-type branched-subunit amino acid transport system substrate-binding protein
MLKPMIGCRIVLAGMLAMLTCFGRAAEPLKIGMVAPLTGPQAETGPYQIQGAKLAVEEINKAGGLLGRPIELVIEDDQATNPGVVLAFSKVAGDKDIPAFIGPLFSTQVHAMAPDIQRTGPVMIGATDPQLRNTGYLFEMGRSRLCALPRFENAHKSVDSVALLQRRRDGVQRFRKELKSVVTKHCCSLSDIGPLTIHIVPDKCVNLGQIQQCNQIELLEDILR